jgi:hypothetical protein
MQVRVGNIETTSLVQGSNEITHNTQCDTLATAEIPIAAVSDKEKLKYRMPKKSC